MVSMGMSSIMDDASRALSGLDYVLQAVDSDNYSFKIYSPVKCPDCGAVGPAKYSLPDGMTVHDCGHESDMAPEPAG